MHGNILMRRQELLGTQHRRNPTDPSCFAFSEICQFRLLHRVPRRSDGALDLLKVADDGRLARAAEIVLAGWLERSGHVEIEQPGDELGLLHARGCGTLALKLHGVHGLFDAEGEKALQGRNALHEAPVEKRFTVGWQAGPPMLGCGFDCGKGG